MSREWSVYKLSRLSFLAGSSVGTFAAVLLGHAQLSRFVGCTSHSLLGSGFLIEPFGKDFIDIFERLEHRARGFRDCLVHQVKLVPHATGSCPRMILA